MLLIISDRLEGENISAINVIPNLSSIDFLATQMRESLQIIKSDLLRGRVRFTG